MIEALHLTKTFKDKKRGVITAVDNVSFTCRPGQIYGLLGANGAGKTTTLPPSRATMSAPSRKRCARTSASSLPAPPSTVA
jgi:sodium transport system ATP-binding protein